MPPPAPPKHHTHTHGHTYSDRATQAGGGSEGTGAEGAGAEGAAAARSHHRLKLRDGTTNMPLRHPKEIASVVSAMVHEVELHRGAGGYDGDERGLRALETHPGYKYEP